MQCPHCFAMCMAKDPFCYNCRRAFPRGPSRAKVVNGVGMVCGMLMFAAVTVFVSKEGGLFINAIAVGIMTAGGYVAGAAIGFVASLFISNH